MLKMEGVYLIHTREFISTDMLIYKIGRSFNIENRTNQYPKGSRVLFMIMCNDSIQCEANLIKLFKEKFTQKHYYGKEYFEGDKKKMIREMFNYIDNIDENKIVNKVKNAKNIKILKDVKDAKDANKKNNTECLNCKTKFKYNSLLKRHLNKKHGCINKNNNQNTKNIIDIQSIKNFNNILNSMIKFKEIENNNSKDENKKYICKTCKLNFASGSSLCNHNKLNRCKGKREIILEENIITDTKKSSIASLNGIIGINSNNSINYSVINENIEFNNNETKEAPIIVKINAKTGLIIDDRED